MWCIALHSKCTQWAEYWVKKVANKAAKRAYIFNYLLYTIVWHIFLQWLWRLIPVCYPQHSRKRLLMQEKLVFLQYLKHPKFYPTLSKITLNKKLPQKRQPRSIVLNRLIFYLWWIAYSLCQWIKGARRCVWCFPGSPCTKVATTYSTGSCILKITSS